VGAAGTLLSLTGIMITVGIVLLMANAISKKVLAPSVMEVDELNLKVSLNDPANFVI
jgi:hypothetical protein